MKSKVFTADSEAAIITAVNDWLTGQTGIAIRRTETQKDEPQAGPTTGPARVTFSVWYDQEDRTP